MTKTLDSIDKLKQKALWVRKQTLEIHRRAPETRLASSLSPVELLVSLYYGGLVKYDPNNRYLPGRDRFFISKGHGSISFYPILADCGFFALEELEKICTTGSFLGGIPDTQIPGYETINGSLGLGLGVACGAAISLKRTNPEVTTFVLSGDGELFIGAVWEAIMFAGQHGLDNLILLVDYNKLCMLDYCENIIDLAPLQDKFMVFGWDVEVVDGHSIAEITKSIEGMKGRKNGKPKALIADTIKGKGVKSLEHDSLCHIRVLNSEQIDLALKELELI
jgi:transketolase